MILCCNEKHWHLVGKVMSNTFLSDKFSQFEPSCRIYWSRISGNCCTMVKQSLDRTGGGRIWGLVAEECGEWWWKNVKKAYPGVMHNTSGTLLYLKFHLHGSFFFFSPLLSLSFEKSLLYRQNVWVMKTSKCCTSVSFINLSVLYTINVWHLPRAAIMSIINHNNKGSIW